jgi:hypothetical protein
MPTARPWSTTIIPEELGKERISTAQDIYHESLLLFEQLVMYMMEQISYALNNYELEIHGW